MYVSMDTCILILFDSHNYGYYFVAQFICFIFDFHGDGPQVRFMDGHRVSYDQISWVFI